MMPGGNRGLGLCLSAPDVCKLPAPPFMIVLVDIGLNAQSVPFSPNIYIAFMPATNMSTQKVLTTGDEAGVGGGVVSGIIKGNATITMGNLVVYINYVPAENLLCLTMGNNYNAPVGAELLPSQVTVLYTLLPPPLPDDHQAGPADAPLSVAETERLLRELRAIAERCWEDEDGAPSLSAELLGGGVGYLRLRAFESGIDRKVYNALTELEPRGLRAVVMDLRGNRGGDAAAALALADDFLPRGTVLARALEADGDEEELLARRSDPYPWPLAMLIDPTTASAAELFAGSLQHHRRAVLVGQRSAGKATAQRLLPQGEAPPQYVTVLRYALADGRSWEGAGLEPDVPATPDEALSEALRQLGS